MEKMRGRVVILNILTPFPIHYGMYYFMLIEDPPLKQPSAMHNHAVRILGINYLKLFNCLVPLKHPKPASITDLSTHLSIEGCLFQNDRVLGLSFDRLN